MKFEINVPDELVKPFLDLMDNVTDTLKKTSEKVQEEVDKFDSKEFQRRTAHIFEEAKSNLEEIDVDGIGNDIKKSIEEMFGHNVRVVSIDDVFKDMFGFNPFRPEREQESEKEETKESEGINMVDKLLVDINEFDNNAASWLMEEIMSGRITEDRYKRALNTKETSATLYFLLRGDDSQWRPTPQGYFFWNAIYEKLGGTVSC